MTWDLDERAWWVFRLPGSPGVEATSYVPAASEEDARRKLAKNSYDGAPVAKWPLIATRVCSRQALETSFLRPRSVATA